MQAASHILMVRPAAFCSNVQTAVNNSFQQPGDDADTARKALEEFDAMVALLRSNKVTVTVVQDTAEPHTPDSIFPNNWFSLHKDGLLVLYPMFAPNRQQERTKPVLQVIRQLQGTGSTIDFTAYEQQGLFLEGTGSLVPDRVNRIAYACLSQRTSAQLVQEWCRIMQYTPVLFTATDTRGRLIYHTNVMMCVADEYAVICLECIADAAERAAVAQSLATAGKEIIDITPAQVNSFAGNMLQVVNTDGEKLLVMSSQAYHALSTEQINRLQHHNRILHTALNTIETAGGGSARCMMAEVF
jgi:hypothetical protein